jgi:uncharacterized protein YbaR (Trm112 family)
MRCAGCTLSSKRKALMTERCEKCGVGIVWPRNVCPACKTPLSAAQRQRLTPAALTEHELALIEADTLRPNYGSKAYSPDVVQRLVVTIRTLQREQRLPGRLF